MHLRADMCRIWVAFSAVALLGACLPLRPMEPHHPVRPRRVVGQCAPIRPAVTGVRAASRKECIGRTSAMLARSAKSAGVQNGTPGANPFNGMRILTASSRNGI